MHAELFVPTSLLFALFTKNYISPRILFGAIESYVKMDDVRLSETSKLSSTLQVSLSRTNPVKINIGFLTYGLAAHPFFIQRLQEITKVRIHIKANKAKAVVRINTDWSTPMHGLNYMV